MAEKRENTRIITPAFVATLAYLNTPSQYGRYTVIGTLDPKNTEHRKHLAQLKKLHTAAVEKARAEFKPTKKIKALTINDAYTQNDDGTYSVTMSEKAVIEWNDKKTGEKKTANLKPALVDAKGQPCDVEVWSGSTLKAAIDVSAYLTPKGECGIRQSLKGVQIIDLKTRGKRDIGFGAVDGGFDASDFMANASAAAAPATDSDDDGDDEFLSDDAAGDETDPLGTDESGSAEAGESTGDDYDF